jgi:hypothetical protein
MPSSLRFSLVAAIAIACHGAAAQTVVPPAVTVQQIAPQLVLFAGSQANFQNLVTGLAQGTPVQLTNTLPNGLTQVVSFTPAAPLSPAQIAQTLETARQQLIGLGIGTPTSEQIAVALMGGVVPTALGGAQVPGVLNPRNPPSVAAQIQANAGAGTTSATPDGTPAITPPVNVQLFPGTTPTTPGADNTAPARINTSDSLVAPGTTSRSPVPAAPTAPGAGLTTAPSSPEPPRAAPPAAGPTPPAPAAPQPARTNSGLTQFRR